MYVPTINLIRTTSTNISTKSGFRIQGCIIIRSLLNGYLIMLIPYGLNKIFTLTTGRDNYLVLITYGPNVEKSKGITSTTDSRTYCERRENAPYYIPSSLPAARGHYLKVNETRSIYASTS